MYFISGVIHDYGALKEVNNECKTFGYFSTQEKAESAIKKEKEIFSMFFVDYQSRNKIDEYDEDNGVEMFLIIEKIKEGVLKTPVWREVYVYDPMFKIFEKADVFDFIDRSETIAFN